MQTIIIGKTRYTVQSDRFDIYTLHAACTGKGKRTKPKAAKRAYPAFFEGMSTADYVRAYFALNTGRRSEFAYDPSLDHAALYEPLPDAPCALYTGTDTYEEVAACE